MVGWGQDRPFALALTESRPVLAASVFSGRNSIACQSAVSASSISSAGFQDPSYMLQRHQAVG